MSFSFWTLLDNSGPSTCCALKVAYRCIGCVVLFPKFVSSCLFFFYFVSSVALQWGCCSYVSNRRQYKPRLRSADEVVENPKGVAVFAHDQGKVKVSFRTFSKQSPNVKRQRRGYRKKGPDIHWVIRWSTVLNCKTPRGCAPSYHIVRAYDGDDATTATIHTLRSDVFVSFVIHVLMYFGLPTHDHEEVGMN